MDAASVIADLHKPVSNVYSQNKTNYALFWVRKKLRPCDCALLMSHCSVCYSFLILLKKTDLLLYHLSTLLSQNQIITEAKASI